MVPTRLRRKLCRSIDNCRVPTILERVKIGTDKIGTKKAPHWSVETELIDVVAAQIGVTRIGGGGRVKPRNEHGRVVSLGHIFAVTVEEVETVVIRAVRKAAPLARSIAMLTVLVVTRALEAAASRLRGWIRRVVRLLPRIAFTAAIWGFPYVLLMLHLWKKL